PLRLVMDEFQNQFVDAPERFHRVNAEELMKMVSIPDQEGHLFYVNEQLIPDHLLHVTTANISELTIRNAIFEKQVDLRGIRGFHLSLRFINCAFNGGLVASEGVFHRSLIFENCVFYK